MRMDCEKCKELEAIIESNTEVLGKARANLEWQDERIKTLEKRWAELSAFVDMLLDGSGTDNNAGCPDEVQEIAEYIVRLTVWTEKEANK